MHEGASDKLYILLRYLLGEVKPEVHIEHTHLRKELLNTTSEPDK